jgi:hypothetical protein
MGNLGRMWIAHVICSGQDCSEEIELVADSLDELERLNCECGYGFAIVSVAEADIVGAGVAEVISISRRDPGRSDSRRAA